MAHTPFRVWCPYCVRARGRNTSHLKNHGINKDKSNEVPRTSMDYFFISQKDEKASANPSMVMVDERTGGKYARAVGHKGISKDQDMEWLIKGLSNELKVREQPGGTTGNIILKLDGEPARLAVRDALAKYHGGTVAQEGPAAGERQSNGRLEEAGKMVKKFVRVLKEQIEEDEREAAVR